MNRQVQKMDGIVPRFCEKVSEECTVQLVQNEARRIYAFLRALPYCTDTSETSAGCQRRASVKGRRQTCLCTPSSCMLRLSRSSASQVPLFGCHSTMTCRTSRRMSQPLHTPANMSPPKIAYYTIYPAGKIYMNVVLLSAFFSVNFNH